MYAAFDDTKLLQYLTLSSSRPSQTMQERLADLQRLKARRNELNAQVRMLREELYHLQGTPM